MKRWMGLLLTAALCLTAAGCGSKVPNTVYSGNDLFGRKIGIIKECAMYAFTTEGYFEKYTSAGTSFQAYADREELTAAVKSGLCDCAITDQRIAEKMVRGGSGLMVLEEIFMVESYSMITARENVNLLADLNSAIGTLEENGTLEKIIDHYLLGTDYEYETRLTEEEISGTITLAVEKDFAPFSFTEEGRLQGIDVDIARAACDELGVGLEIKTLDRSQVAAEIMNGTADFAMARWTANEKDQELVAFTDVYFTSDQVIVVRK